MTTKQNQPETTPKTEAIVGRDHYRVRKTVEAKKSTETIVTLSDVAADAARDAEQILRGDTQHQIAVELYAVNGEPPAERELFPAGKTETSKGTFLFDAKSAEEVMSAYHDHGVELSFDYDHKMLDASGPPENGIAAGWFRPEVRDGALWATSIRWTPRAAEMLRNREFRYLSPAFFAERSTGRITRLINVALTNVPATKNIRPLIARHDTAGASATENHKMLEILAALLGCEPTEAAVTTALKDKAAEHSTALATLGDARTIVGLTDGETLPAKLTALVAAAAKVESLEAALAESTEKLAAVEADRAKALADAEAAKLAEATREVEWIVAHSERYDLGKFGEGAKTMLLAARAAAPEAFANTYKAALDGLRAGDTDEMFTDSATLTGKPKTDERATGEIDATADVFAKAEALAKKDGIPLSAALSRVTSDAIASVGR